MIAFWPVLYDLKRVYGPRIWAHPKLFLALATYGSFLHVSASEGLGFARILALSLIATGVRTEILRRRLNPWETLYCMSRPRLWAFYLWPFVVFVVTRLTHGALFDRYLLWVVLPMAIIPGYFSRD
jgi:hypothetical protein